MLNECACGEPLFDSQARCPGCGAANREYVGPGRGLAIVAISALALAALLVPASGGALWAVALAVAAVGAAVALRIRKSRAREGGMARGPARRRERNSMRVEVTLAPADEVGVAYSPRRTAYAKPFVLFLAWFGITGVVLGGLFLEQGHRLTLKQLLIAAALMIVPFLVSYFDREMKADALASAAPDVVFELRPEGIQVERQGRGSLLENVLVRWQDLQGMENTRDHILLQTRTDRFVVPRRCFSSPAECTQFMQYIQAHVRAGRSRQHGTSAPSTAHDLRL